MKKKFKTLSDDLERIQETLGPMGFDGISTPEEAKEVVRETWTNRGDRVLSEEEQEELDDALALVEGRFDEIQEHQQ